MTTKKISPELLAFGSEVQHLRAAADINQEHLAAQVNVTRSYIGQVERGITRCRRDFAERLDIALNSGDHLQATWDELIRQTKYPKYYVKFPKMEASATVLRAYESSAVYGLFQTEAYAAALIKRPEGVTVRMGRQRKVFSDPQPKIFVVMDEGVLYRQVESNKVMREQLERLIEVSNMDEVRLQLIPMEFYVEAARAPFGIATQEDRSECAFLVNAAGGETTTDEVQLAELSKSFATLQSEALNVRDTRTLIGKAVTERWT